MIDRLSHFYAHENSNVHRAAHALAARSTDAFEAAREKVRRFINAPSDDTVVWVRGTTEAINLVAKAWGGRNVQEGDEVVVTHLEHHSNIVPWQMLCAEKGAKLRVAPVDDRGDVLLDEYEKLLNPRTRIVSFTQVSNALGTVTPAREMIEMAHRHGARVLVDGAQAVSHMPVDVQALDADFYVFSGHKVFAPTGVGVLYGKPGELEAMPPWQGGGSMIKDVTFEESVYQEPPEKFEAGTGTIADAVGLGAAIDYLESIGMANIAAYEHGLLAYALDGLRTVPGLTLVGSPKERAGAISLRARRLPGGGCRRRAQPRRHRRARRPSLRPADPAPLRLRDHRASVDRALQHQGRHRRARCRAAAHRCREGQARSYSAARTFPWRKGPENISSSSAAERAECCSPAICCARTMTRSA